MMCKKCGSKLEIKGEEHPLIKDESKNLVTSCTGCGEERIFSFLRVSYLIPMISSTPPFPSSFAEAVYYAH